MSKKKLHRNKARLNEYQVNVKLTEQEYGKIQAINDKFFNGELVHVQLGRFLFDVACDYLEKAEVKTQTREIVMVNGVPLTEIK